MTAQELLTRLNGVRVLANKQWEALCPRHEDHTPSLSIGESFDGKLLLNCHAGCPVERIVEVLGLKMSDLFPSPKGKSRGKIVATYNYRDEPGNLLFQVVRLEPKSFRQRVPNGKGRWSWRLGEVRRVLYRLPELLNVDPGAFVFIVEGEKDVERLVNLGLVATCNPGGAGKWTVVADLARQVLTDRNVVIIPDADDPGRHHAEDVARRLAGAASTIRILELPGLPPKGDASDWIAGGGSRDALLALAAESPPFEPPPAPPPTPVSVPQSNRPTIIVATDEHRVIDEAVVGLATDSRLYQRGGELVVIRNESPGHRGRIAALPIATLRERLTEVASWERWKKKDLVPAHPPEWAVKGVAARGTWSGIRRLSGIRYAPTMRPDGSILDAPGYDLATGILYAPDHAFPAVPTNPTNAEVRDAVNALLEPFTDFPFRDANCDLAAAVAAIFTIVARPAIVGHVPLIAFRSPTPGSGKGLLVDAISLSATGAAAKLVTAPTDDAEWRKLMLSLAREGADIVSLDNVEGALGAPALAAILTSDRVTDRVLGVSATISVETQTVWFATGNGVTFKRDLARRALVIDLDPAVESPEDRGGWKYPDLLAHVKSIWEHLVVGALTILRAYHLAGRPAHGKARLGSFEAWDDLVRGACVWAGLGDPDGGRLRMRDEGDDDKHALGAVLSCLAEGHASMAFSSATLCVLASGDTELDAALCSLVGGWLKPHPLGLALHRCEGRIVGGLVLKAAGKHHGTRRWRVERVGDGVALGGGPNETATQAATHLSPTVRQVQGAGGGGDCRSSRKLSGDTPPDWLVHLDTGTAEAPPPPPPTPPTPTVAAPAPQSGERQPRSHRRSGGSV